MNNRVEMRTIDPNIRNKNFEEVALGYSNEEALLEASRCLNCKAKPCVKGCPVNIDIPGFISKIKENNINEAYNIISKSSLLPAICGRVCPQENQCEKYCVRGVKSLPVAIGRLERYVADNNTCSTKFDIIKNNIKVAVIGSGPAGLSCASELAIMGYDVCVFEALHVAGGVLVYGIPEFRLPKDIVQKEINKLIAMGVKIQTNTVIGKTLTFDDLYDEGYKAIFIGSGAGLPKFMNIPGENLKGVYSANEYLTRINLMKAYLNDSQTPIMKPKNVAVVGGGNVAMDAARCAKRMGADNVYIIYRRSMSELPARKEEVKHAIEEGIEFVLLTNPVEIIGDENKFVDKIKCIKMELGAPDESGRRRPIEVSNSEYDIKVEAVIMALGTSPNPLIKNSTKNLEVQRWGGIVIDEQTFATSIEGVYAGGDAVTGSATVILAMGAGKSAAKSIDDYLKNKF